MEARNEIVMEVRKEDRVYRFSMPNNASLGETYLAVGDIMDEVIRLINEHQKKIKPEEEAAEG